MQATDPVDAALAGLDQGELVTIAELHVGYAWTRWKQERRELAPKFRNSRPAARNAVA